MERPVPRTERGAGVAVAPAPPAVEMSGITKRFGDVVACDGVDLAVMPGRITGLLGENGAGKSTLMRILMGLASPDAGEIRIRGRRVTIRDQRQAAALGLGMVHQQPALVSTLRVWENTVLGDHGRLDAELARRRVRDVGARYGLEVDPEAVIDSLSAGQRQRVELIRCLARDPRVLVLDEPTAVLTVAEAQALFAVLRRVVVDEQRAVVLISHRLGEVLSATDEVIVLRRGRVSAHHRSAGVDAATLVSEMSGGVGAAVVPERPVRTMPPPGGTPALRISDLRIDGRGGRSALRGLSLVVRPGEILGVAALEGNGQSTLVDVFIDREVAASGTVEVGGHMVRPGRPGGMQRAGVGVITDDPQRSGLVLDMSVVDNLLLADLGAFSARGILRRGRMRARAADLMARHGIRAASPRAPVRSLSGGNQQRVVLARELSRRPVVLIATQVTRGLDAAAARQATDSIHTAAREGSGVVLVSAEPEELLALCDRVAVLHRGRIVGDLSARDTTVERLLMMMGGDPG